MNKIPMKSDKAKGAKMQVAKLIVKKKIAGKKGKIRNKK